MNDAARVEWMTSVMGGVPRHLYAAAFPPDRFYCLLDELPMHLVRQSTRRGWRGSRPDPPLEQNEKCLIRSAEQIPAEFDHCRDLLAGFALQGTIAWVPDEFTGSLLPFWTGPELQLLLQRLSDGGIVANDFPIFSRRLLQEAGILTAAQNGRAARTRGETALQSAAEMFRHKKYAPVADLIHPFHIAALRRYYRHQIRSGAIYLGDEQSARRYVAHNEPVARFFHHQISAKLSKIAGEPLKPSYVYLASYLSGAELNKHTDREQCDFSVTLCVDFSPEPQFATPWPIKLDSPSGTVIVYQGIGDGLAYRGAQLPHYRHPLGSGQTSTSIFFHYVPEHYAGPLD